MPTANSSASKEAVTAALLVIGSKILSGRTKDQNVGYIAEYLTAVGIDLKEVRVVGDEEGAIVDAVMRSGVTAPMSSPPVGSGRPTVTRRYCVAKAFGVPIDSDPRSLAILRPAPK
jgi:molybdopterin-biosynthesis enzyme MoeA-like protein